MLETGQILIAGAGNLLVGDDGIGVHAIRQLQKEHIPGVTMIEMGTAILHGLHFVESASRVLLIDAAKGGHSPGTIYLFESNPASGGNPVTSVHALGLREAMRLLPPTLSTPPMTVIGVEPAALAYTMELSEAVQAALPKVVALARETVSGWLRSRSQLVPCLAEA